MYLLLMTSYMNSMEVTIFRRWIRNLAIIKSKYVRTTSRKQLFRSNNGHQLWVYDIWMTYFDFYLQRYVLVLFYDILICSPNWQMRICCILNLLIKKFCSNTKLRQIRRNQLNTWNISFLVKLSRSGCWSCKSSSYILAWLT